MQILFIAHGLRDYQSWILEKQVAANATLASQE